METPRCLDSSRPSAARVLVLVVSLAFAAQSVAAQGGARPMTFLDVQQMRTTGSFAVSADGQSLLYTLSVPNWKEAKRFTDVWMVSTSRGAQSARQLTFTKDKNEINPRWAPDGKLFVFASNRDAPQNAATQNQVFAMRADGGEARRITDAKDGVGQFGFTRDGRWLVYSAGKTDEQQLWALPVATLDSARPVALTHHAAPVGNWQITRDSKKVVFLSPDSVDKDDKARIEKKFDVKIRNPETPLTHLWALDLDTKQEKRLTSDATYAVTNFTISPDSKWIGFNALPNDRYARTVTEANDYADVYLLNVETGAIERLTKNVDVSESPVSFSPKSDMLAFSGAENFTYFRLNKLYVRPVAEAGAKLRMLGTGFDGDVTPGFWSEDEKTIYFNEGWRATNELFSVDVASGKVTQLTNEKASLSVARDEDSNTLLINYSDPVTPPSLYTAASLGAVADRKSWTRLTDANPQARQFALGEEEEITWKSADGKMVGGVLLKPVGYQAGQRYPLIVSIHGGPAGADLLNFNGGYGAQIYAGAGYAVLMPNYRGSTNYGEAHKNAIVGNYFQKGYEDIMTGVDHLIAQGIVDGDKMGALGWSAGGHWSNWILTHTNRFKAISTGAGTMNWISMYAQSDVQRNRQNYLGGKLPYDNFDAYWNQSPLKYIKNAKTPTMIHVVHDDPRVPRPQSEELHMALKKLGVPTEFFEYPGASHGIPDPRNQLVKSVAEMAWMDHWIRGKGNFQWKQVLQTLEEKEAGAIAATSP